MPKKPHGRPAKARTRARRPAAARPSPASGELAPAGQNLVAERVPVAASGSGVPARSVSGAAPAPPVARRSTAAGKRAPATVINYRYLRRDITTLSVLAPAMVVVLIILFFVLHY